MANTSESGTTRDGRRARGERTRLRVLEALLELVEEGELRPTAQEVAERAGVALRTVYHHFEDVAALRSMAFMMQAERHRELLRPVDAALPLEERIQQMTRQYRRLFEAITPLRLAGLLDQRESEEMAEDLRRSGERRRAQLASSFAPELERRGKDRDGRPLLDALDLVVSWETWNYLRSSLGRSALGAEKVIVLLLTDLLSPARTEGPGEVVQARARAGGRRAGPRRTSAARGASTAGRESAVAGRRRAS